jgi:hypothetical protein
VLVVRNGRGLKVVARPSAEIGIPTPGSSTDPTLAPSSIMVTSAGGGLLVESLQPAGWRGLGSPAGVRGYRYRGDGTPTRPFRLVVLKRRLVKMIAADDGTLGARTTSMSSCASAPRPRWTPTVRASGERRSSMVPAP